MYPRNHLTQPGASEKAAAPFLSYKIPVQTIYSKRKKTPPPKKDIDKGKQVNNSDDSRRSYFQDR